VAQQVQRGDGVGAGGEAAGVARRLAAGDLQRQIAQRVGGEQGLVDRRFAARIGQRGLLRPSSGGAQAVDFREAVGEYWMPSQKAGGVSGFDCIWAFMALPFTI
jgi:hypothetical protein